MENLSHMWDNVFGGLTSIFVALIVLVIAILLGWLTKYLIVKLLKVAGLPKALMKAGIKNDKINGVLGFIGRLAFLVVFLLFLPGIFSKLGLESIGVPITAMMNDFMVYLPKIIGAVLILMVGLFIARLVKELLRPILHKTKLNSWVEKAGLDVEKISISDILVNLIYVVIVVFFTVEAINTLQLDILTKIGEEIIHYLPYALSAAIIMLLAYLLGSWVETALVKNFKTSKVVALAVKIVVIVIGAFLTLFQLGVAPEMVNAAFIIMLGAVGVAFAIAFGIGGRDFAAHTMRKIEMRMDERERMKKMRK